MPLLLGLQKRGSLENPLFQKFSPEEESEVLIFWVASCFTDINIAKKGLLLAAFARDICIFLLRDMTVPNMLDVQQVNNVCLIEMEFKIFLVHMLPPLSVETNTEV